MLLDYLLTGNQSVMNVPSKDAMKQYRYDPTRPHDPYSWEAPRSWKRALDHIRDTYRERRHRAGFSEGFPSFPLAVEDVFSSWSDDEEMQRHLQRSHPEGRDYVPELDATDDDR